MHLRRLAWRNVWRSRARYAAYLGSASFSVLVFFLFNSLILHPDFQGGFAGAQTAASAMRAGSVVVVVFTFFFLLYANSAFVQFRQQEFGLLRLVGVTRGQLARLMMWEGLTIGLVAVAAGGGLGLLLVKLFFMGISVLLGLGESIPFYAGLDVWLRTAAVFGAVFLIISVHAIWKVMKQPIIKLLRARRRPKDSPVFSRWKVVLGLLLLGAGYAMTFLVDAEHMVLAAVPITVMVSIATSLLVQEGSIALLVRLHRNESRFYRPVSFLNLSRLLFKLQDNARTITSVSLLVAVILTAMGTIYSVYAVVGDETRALHPLSLEITRFGTEDFSEDADQITSILEHNGLDVLHRWHLATAMADLQTETTEMYVTLVPYSLYRDIRRAQGINALPMSGPDDAIIVVTHPPEGLGRQPYQLAVGGRPIAPEGRLQLDTAGRMFSSRFWASAVLHDDTFAAIMESLPEHEWSRLALAGWTTSPEIGTTALGAYEQVQKEVDLAAEGTYTASLAESHSVRITTWSVILFMAVFASLVFFAACCSLLYFRLYTEIEDDRRYYSRLQHLGVGRDVLRQVSRRQMLVVFFAPFAIGLIHSTFAMQALGVVIMRNVFHYGWLMAAMYLVIFGLYYAGIEGFYRRSLGLASSES